MKGVNFEQANGVLAAPKGQEGSVYDLPVCQFRYSDGMPAVASCWELSDEELEEINKTKRVYFLCYGTTHPPIRLEGAEPVEFDGMVQE